MSHLFSENLNLILYRYLQSFLHWTVNGEWWMDHCSAQSSKCRMQTYKDISNSKLNEHKNQMVTNDWNWNEWFGAENGMQFYFHIKNSSNFPITNCKWTYIKRSFISVWIFDANIKRSFNEQYSWI